MRKEEFFKYKNKIYKFYDRTLFLLFIGLISIGFIIASSASIRTGERLFNDPLYFIKRNIIYITFVLLISITVLEIPISFWEENSSKLLFISLFMLLLVILFGNSVKGAYRWISVGSISIQPSEFSKLSFICYLSKYFSLRVRNYYESSLELYKLLIMSIFLSIFLLLQPDFGTIIIMFVSTLSMLFLLGMKLWKFLSVLFLSTLISIVLIFIKPYRIQRIISFWNPWDDPFGRGYQLTQSLMAFGRGRLFGQGLGNSIQKLEYLPESHTDFIFAILGEELGYFGIISVLTIIFMIILRALRIFKRSLKINQFFSGFLSFSIAIWISFQTIINAGVASGIFPTKGLTLPLISYGGSSLLTTSLSIMILLRIDFEIRLNKEQAFDRNNI